MAETKPLKSYKCSSIEYMTGRRIKVPEPVTVQPLPTKAKAMIPTANMGKKATSIKSNTRVRCDVEPDDEEKVKNVHWDEEALKERQHASNCPQVRRYIIELCSQELWNFEESQDAIWCITNHC
jgi:hypothetical protein